MQNYLYFVLKAEYLEGDNLYLLLGHTYNEQRVMMNILSQTENSCH